MNKHTTLHNPLFQKEDEIISALKTIVQEVFNAYHLFSNKRFPEVKFATDKVFDKQDVVDSDFNLVVTMMVGSIGLYEESKRFEWEELKRKHGIDEPGSVTPVLRQLIDGSIRELVFKIIGRAFAKDALNGYVDILKRIEEEELRVLKKDKFKGNKVV
jgi:hypothetical protein